MSGLLDSYARPAGPEVIDHLRQVARPLAGAKVVHVNSTATGGGVAEILRRLVPLMRELGIEASWELIEGDAEFFATTKTFHNALQGNKVDASRRALENYERINRANAARLRPALEAADFVFIHDPQPAALLRYQQGERHGHWIWRCHIDVSRPHRPIWKYLREFVRAYDASVFSLAAFAQPLPHPQYLIHPSIDPISEKNVLLPAREVESVLDRFGLDRARPILLQVSRFDRFKDPVGVIRAYQLVKPHAPVQLVLAGGTASDDPEGEDVLAEARDAAAGDPDIHILLLPSDAHRDINALQRGATLVLQKSLREGFGLTVTEALWKGRPVIGGDTGGITLQVVDRHTGFLVSTPEGAAFRIRYLLSRPDLIAEMGRKGRKLVRENFLLTRHLREYMTLMLSLRHGAQDRLEIA
jgi:trehalose synthase